MERKDSGTPESTNVKAQPLLDRFNEKWIPEPNSGCWIWTGAGYPNGYAKFHKDNKRILAHRESYRLYHGEIPEGMVLDHLCKTRSCVNPNHLEVVTMAENLRRGNGFAGIQSRRTNCIHGHPLSGDNLYEHDGHRYCKTCRRNVNRKRQNWKGGTRVSNV